MLENTRFFCLFGIRRSYLFFKTRERDKKKKINVENKRVM